MKKITKNTTNLQNNMKDLVKVLSITKKNSDRISIKKDSVNIISIENKLELDIFDNSSISLVNEDAQESIIFNKDNIKQLEKALKYFSVRYNTSIEQADDARNIKIINKGKSIEFKAAEKKNSNYYSIKNKIKELEKLETTNIEYIHFKEDQFYTVLKKLEKFMSKDDLNLRFKGITFDGSTIYALDGYKMAKTSISNYLSADSTFAIPDMAVKILLKLLNKKLNKDVKIEIVTVSETESYSIVNFNNNSKKLYIKNMKETNKFDYESLFNKNNSNLSLKLDLNEMLKLIKYIQNFTDKLITLEFDTNNNFIIASNKKNSNSTSKVEGKIEILEIERSALKNELIKDDSLNISLNINYLIELLESSNLTSLSNVINLSVFNTVEPLFFSKENFDYLVLPIRIP